jgi:serine protease inhibitor
MNMQTTAKGLILGFVSLMMLPAYAEKGDSEMKSIKGPQSMAFRLFSQLAASKKGENILISPLSIDQALSLAYSGAADKTAQQMAAVLGLTGIPIESVCKNSQAMVSEIEASDPKVQLLCANALWVKKDVKLEPNFVDGAKNFFKAQVASLDFSQPSALTTINDWVNKCTKGKIKDILNRLDKATALVITNAVYFKGNWSQPFELANTDQNGKFTLASGASVKMPMMFRSGHFTYGDDGNLQAVQLPYGHGRVCMYVLLPHKNQNLSDLIASINPQSFGKIIEGMRSASGSVRLPRFTIKTSEDLSQSLKAMGMELAFSPRLANFKNISNTLESLYIGAVLHKALIEVNEKGTEAGAATAVTMMAMARMDPEKPFEMNVDRPFVLALCDTESNELLFLGGVFKPEAL